MPLLPSIISPPPAKLHQGEEVDRIHLLNAIVPPTEISFSLAPKQKATYVGQHPVLVGTERACGLVPMTVQQVILAPILLDTSRNTGIPRQHTKNQSDTGANTVVQELKTHWMAAASSSLLDWLHRTCPLCQWLPSNSYVILR
jgi:hypothetical protein